MVAFTGPRISQVRLFLIVVILVMASFILFGIIAAAYNHFQDVAFCRQVDRTFISRHYVLDSADNICKSIESDNAN